MAYALCRAGCRVLILNRTESRATALAEELGCRWGGLDDRGRAMMGSFNDLLVQTTSVGMSPDADADTLEGYTFDGHEIAYDIIYTPPLTRFLKRARAAGCRTIGGWDMLLNQAMEQFRLFTGSPYPEEAAEFLGGPSEVDGPTF